MIQKRNPKRKVPDLQSSNPDKLRQQGSVKEMPERRKMAGRDGETETELFLTMKIEADC